MSDKINDGGSAFPLSVSTSPSGDVYTAYPGMSLRDYFAAKTLPYVLENTPLRGTEGYFGPARAGSPVHREAVKKRREEVAETAYLIADAMLAERAKAEGEQP